MVAVGELDARLLELCDKLCKLGGYSGGRGDEGNVHALSEYGGVAVINGLIIGRSLILAAGGSITSAGSYVSASLAFAVSVRLLTCKTGGDGNYKADKQKQKCN